MDTRRQRANAGAFVGKLAPEPMEGVFRYHPLVTRIALRASERQRSGTRSSAVSPYHRARVRRTLRVSVTIASL